MVRIARVILQNDRECAGRCMKVERGILTEETLDKTGEFYNKKQKVEE